MDLGDSEDDILPGEVLPFDVFFEFDDLGGRRREIGGESNWDVGPSEATAGFEPPLSGDQGSIGIDHHRVDQSDARDGLLQVVGGEFSALPLVAANEDGRDWKSQSVGGEGQRYFSLGSAICEERAISWIASQ